MKRMSGKQVRTLREKQGLTRGEFAERIYASEQQVKKWEDGTNGVLPSLSHLIRITFDPIARSQWLRHVANQDKL